VLTSYKEVEDHVSGKTVGRSCAMDLGKGCRSIYEDEELVINVGITWIQLGMFHNRISAPIVFVSLPYDP
jgi:hypothetical protein